MTDKEKIKKDISLAFDFIEYLIHHPDALRSIPKESTITFLESGTPAIEKKREKFTRKFVRVKHEFELL